VGLVAVLLAVTIASRPDGRLHLTVLDIGQGDAILVEAPSGGTMLIDGGPDPELTLRRIGANLPFFARRIDLLVLSHPHQDHVAGLVDVLDRFRVGAVLHAGIPFGNPAYGRLLTGAATTGVRVAVLRAGQAIDLGGGTLARVLYPTQADADAPLPEGDINNGSVVLRLELGGFAALLTGDAEAPIESVLASRGLLDAVDVLKVGHHGSNSSTTPGLVDAIQPSVAIISAGVGNEYGHPAPETLAALATHRGISVFRTDLQGDVEVVTDGTTLRVRTDAGWSPTIAVHRHPATGSVGPWRSPIRASVQSGDGGLPELRRVESRALPSVRVLRHSTRRNRRGARGAPDGHDRVQRPAGIDEAGGGPRPRVRPRGDDPLLRRHDRPAAPARRDDREVHRRRHHGGLRAAADPRG
jgi:competence protein ComEC